MGRNPLNKLKIYWMLSKGHAVSEISKKLNITEQNIYLYIRKGLATGMITKEKSIVYKLADGFNIAVATGVLSRGKHYPVDINWLNEGV